MADHLNNIERALIDDLRNKDEDGDHPWGLGEVTVFGQFPETEDVKYPCIVVEMVANGIEEQFLGQSVSTASEENVTGEIYGIAFNIHCACDINSTLSTGDGAGFKQRRLINYLMLNVANILMDCNFIGATPSTEVTQRYHTGFREVSYNPDLETWAATTGMVVVFVNSRS
jgi:hypothetical protein